jgi:hypothetical protein
MTVMIETGRLAHDGDDCWSREPWHADAWRRGRDVLDAYDEDRVLSEELADDLVNELAGRALGARRRRPDADRPWRPGMLAGTGVEGRGRRRRPHLTLVPGGRDG